MISDADAESKNWRVTFYTMWFGCFMTGLGFSMTMPFLSLYVSSLGNFTHFQVSFYSGIAFAVTYLAQAIISPYWGALADQKGRKLMCLRASGVMAFTILLTGLVNNVWLVILLRLLQGLFSGYINNATALMAAATSKNKSGMVMTNMMTASVTGSLLGPLFGGVLANYFGYRIPFIVTGIIMAIVFVTTWKFAKEDFVPVSVKDVKHGSEFWHSFKDLKLIFSLLLTTFIVQTSLMSIGPIISLYVKELMNGQGNVSLVSGFVAAMPGFGSILVANKIGHKMDKIGSAKILIGGLILASLFFIPMYFVTSPWTLAFWRFMLGGASAAMLPAVQTALTVNAPKEVFGRLFSYNQSSQAIGGVVGPLLGALISGIFNYKAIFIVTAILLVINLIILILNKEHLKLLRK